MTDLTAQILHYNPHQAQAIIDFIDDKDFTDEDSKERAINFSCDITEFQTCVVGEIHCYDDSYALNKYDFDVDLNDELYCNDCKEFANQLSVLYTDNARQNFAQVLVSLYDHVRNEHVMDKHQ